MDYFKIITILFMIIIIYQIYLMNCRFNSIEGFEGSAQSLGGVDDTNAINTLAQIAKNLMAGGVTVPGNMTVQGALNPAHSVWHSSTDGKHRIHYGNNSHSFYKTADAHVWRNRDDHDRMVLDHNANLRVDGALNVSGNANLANFTIKKGTASPDNSKIQWGDGTGWRLRFQKDDSNPTMDVYDNGSVNITRSLIVGGRDILGELDQCIKNGQVIYNQRTQDGRFVWGDGVGHPDSGWSRWIIRKA